LKDLPGQYVGTDYSVTKNDAVDINQIDSVKKLILMLMFIYYSCCCFSKNSFQKLPSHFVCEICIGD